MAGSSTTDALDSGEEDFSGPAFREAGFYNDSLVGDGHLRDTAFQQADSEENRPDYETNRAQKYMALREVQPRLLANLKAPR